MSKVPKLAVNDRVQLIPFKHKGKLGYVRFIGNIAGKPVGNWIGIELDDAVGENSGEYLNSKLFDCKENHGIFLRPSQVKSLEPGATSNVGTASCIALLLNLF